MSRRASRILVTLGIILVIVVAYLATTVILDSARDPEIQRRVQELQQSTSAAPADTAAQDTVAQRGAASDPSSPAPDTLGTSPRDR